MARDIPARLRRRLSRQFEQFGGNAQWAPNEKVALEVGIGVSFAGGRSIVTMKHVGLNVAADPLFTVAYTDVSGALIVVSADDPGMASSQNEQDNRRYAVAAAIPMLEPSDSQEAYDFTFLAIEISERWHVPVLLRMTTRVCHSKTIMERRQQRLPARPADYTKRCARALDDARQCPRQPIADCARSCGRSRNGASSPGRRRSSTARARWASLPPASRIQHVREAAPEASVLKLGMTYPLPIETIRKFAARRGPVPGGRRSRSVPGRADSNRGDRGGR